MCSGVAGFLLVPFLGQNPVDLHDDVDSAIPVECEHNPFTNIEVVVLQLFLERCDGCRVVDASQLDDGLASDEEVAVRPAFSPSKLPPLLDRAAAECIRRPL